MRIELLYVDGCPNVTPTLQQLNTILAESGLNHAIMLTMVGDPEAAQAIRFLGSPTVRINGVDIEPAARQRPDFGLMCRTYQNSGVPSEALVRSAITEAKQSAEERESPSP